MGWGEKEKEEEDTRLGMNTRGKKMCVWIHPMTHKSRSILIVVFRCDPAEPGSHHRCTVQHGCHSFSTPRAIQQHIHNIDTVKPSWAFLDT